MKHDRDPDVDQATPAILIWTLGFSIACIIAAEKNLVVGLLLIGFAVYVAISQFAYEYALERKERRVKRFVRLSKKNINEALKTSQRGSQGCQRKDVR